MKTEKLEESKQVSIDALVKSKSFIVYGLLPMDKHFTHFYGGASLLSDGIFFIIYRFCTIMSKYLNKPIKEVRGRLLAMLSDDTLWQALSEDE